MAFLRCACVNNTFQSQYTDGLVREFHIFGLRINQKFNNQKEIEEFMAFLPPQWQNKERQIKCVELINEKIERRTKQKKTG